MHQRLVWILLVMASIQGCGDSKTQVKAPPLTEEQKQQIKAADQAVDDEERSGSGTATRVKKKK